MHNFLQEVGGQFIYFLPENVKVTSRRIEREIHRVNSGLDSIIERLISGEHYAPQEGDECRWCDYKHYCPLRTGSPLELPMRVTQPELAFGKNKAAYSCWSSHSSAGGA